MLGYIAAVLIGISLGLIGGGGSILTMPVLVYLFDAPPVLATSYSLFIVGFTSLVGTIINYRKGHVSSKTAILFGIPSIVTVFAIRKFLIPRLPEQITYISGMSITTPLITMLLFALLMIAAAIAMIRKKSQEHAGAALPDKGNAVTLLAYGVGIGLVTGFLGAGGGFLLIPVLVLLLHHPMKVAIGTSLMIIAMNSLLGFAGDLGNFELDWSLLLSISALAVAGMFAGVLLAQKIDGGKLKRVFGWFVLAMGFFILVKELLATYQVP